MNLLTRDQFKIQVFNRDEHKCVVCKQTSVDAHHILERCLWTDGGYYLDNGVSLCSQHHLEAEKTSITCETLRELAGITTVILPDHFYHDEHYDKWGNICLPSGAKIKGELFRNENVQRALRQAGQLSSFLPYIKYPRTYHFPWSKNLKNDDRMHSGVDFFDGKEVVGTIKLDGENTSMYSNYVHARSVDSSHHLSRSFVKQIHAAIAHDIPEGWRLCGENMYAKHSIHYRHLAAYFYLFSIWDEFNVALSWDDTLEWAQILGLNIVPVFYRGQWDREKIHAAYEDYETEDDKEGYVVRIADAIPYKDFRHSFGKFVRKNHVQTSEFWMTQPVVPNKLSVK